MLEYNDLSQFKSHERGVLLTICGLDEQEGIVSAYGEDEICKFTWTLQYNQQIVSLRHCKIMRVCHEELTISKSGQLPIIHLYS